jgi:hypothetical protein
MKFKEPGMSIKKRRNRFTILTVWPFGAASLFALSGCMPVITSFSPMEGAAGSTVTITGKGFKNAPTGNIVTFGQSAVLPCDILSATATAITCRVPANAQTGLISVTTGDGTGRSTLNFRISGPPKWTVMVYLNADNNLESAGLDDFREMASIGSNENLKIVVQMDRGPDYPDADGNWTDTRRFLIHAGDTPASPPLDTLGEVNMGDSLALRDFVVWAMAAFPADHYALVVWDHGDGWRKLQEVTPQSLKKVHGMGSVGEENFSKAVSNDETDGDILYMHEVQWALTRAGDRLASKNGAAKKIDVVIFDACLMGMIETAYALRDAASFMVGSEWLEPGPGMPYDSILAPFSSGAALTPKQLATRVVTQYGAAYRYEITCSAFDLSNVIPAASAIDSFANAMKTEWDKLKIARAGAKQFHVDGFTTTWGVDIWDFADKVDSNVVSPAIKSRAGKVKSAIEQLIIAETHTADWTGSHGAAIYFPTDQSSFTADPQHTGYDKTNTFMPVDFVRERTWDTWLQTYYANNQ